eukprot:Platyproteum_vivax@DN3549_c0_g1_i1.p1
MFFWATVSYYVRKFFRRINPIRVSKYLYMRAAKYERRTSMISAGVPFVFIMVTCTTIGTIVMDRQAELRYLRTQSLGQREHTLEEEHERVMEFLKAADDYDHLDNSVPIPRVTIPPHITNN